MPIAAKLTSRVTKRRPQTAMRTRRAVTSHAWKQMQWGDLDALGVPVGTTVVLQHSKLRRFTAQTSARSPLSVTLQNLMRTGRACGNHKIAGFVKTCEYTRLRLSNAPNAAEESLVKLLVARSATQPTQPAQPTAPAQPAQPTAPAQPAQPTAPAQPAQSAQTTAPTTPTVPTPAPTSAMPTAPASEQNPLVSLRGTHTTHATHDMHATHATHDTHATQATHDTHDTHATHATQDTNDTNDPVLRVVQAIAEEVFAELKAGNTEQCYQTAMLFRLYHNRIPAITEVPITFQTKYGPIPAGRADLEVEHSYLFELKVTPYNPKDTIQLQRYMRALQSQGRAVKGAAVICFTDRVSWIPVTL